MQDEPKIVKVYEISRGFMAGHPLSKSQRYSGLFSEEPTVLGKVLRKGAQPLSITEPIYRHHEHNLMRLKKAGTIKIEEKFLIGKNPVPVDAAKLRAFLEQNHFQVEPPQAEGLTHLSGGVEFPTRMPEDAGAEDTTPEDTGAAFMELYTEAMKDNPSADLLLERLQSAVEQGWTSQTRVHELVASYSQARPLEQSVTSAEVATDTPAPLDPGAMADLGREAEESAMAPDVMTVSPDDIVPETIDVQPVTTKDTHPPSERPARSGRGNRGR